MTNVSLIRLQLCGPQNICKMDKISSDKESISKRRAARLKKYLLLYFQLLWVASLIS